MGTVAIVPEESEAAEEAADAAVESVDADTARVFSPYGIASAVLAVLCVGAVLLSLKIWSDHREHADNLAYQARAAQAAVDWTGVLINMNAGNVDSSLQTLQDKAVGQLSTDFDRSMQPYRDVVKTLQSSSNGQINSVAIEQVYNDLDRRPGTPPPADPMAGLASRTDTVLIVATSVTENVGAEPRTIDWESAGRRVQRPRRVDDLQTGVASVRNAARVLAFDLLAPLAVITALVAIGFALGWPLWWVSVCSILCLLLVQGMLANFFLARRDRVTVGTDDDAPGLRFVVVAVTTAAVFAAAFVTYSHWAAPDRQYDQDLAEVVRLATTVSEATASFSPRNPDESIDRAVALMVPEQGQTYKDAFTKTAADLAAKNVTAQARTISAGVEAIGPGCRERGHCAAGDTVQAQRKAGPGGLGTAGHTDQRGG